MNRTAKIILFNAIAATVFICSHPPVFADALRIEETKVHQNVVVVNGRSEIEPSRSSYVQYYVGKLYEGTLSTCIYCDGFNTDSDGAFSLEIPIERLKGDGRYEIVLEQNPKADTILPPEHWVAFRKKDGEILFGDITSMGEIANLALTVGMEIARTEITIGEATASPSEINIISVVQIGDKVIIRGSSGVDKSKSTYIQYYVGKVFPGTLSNCILADGFSVASDGSFELAIPVSSLKGPGTYEIALEQNPRSNTILPPPHWVAFRKTDDGIVFGDISSMGEIANLALTVGMELSRTTFSIK